MFEIAAGSNAVTTLVNFSGTGNGGSPGADIVMDSYGNIFGTTSSGGAAGDGTVFEVAASSYAFTTLLTFNGTGNGSGPSAGLYEDNNGNLFGTTTSGGANNKGTLFELAAGTYAFSTLVNFSGTSYGSAPVGSLVEDSSGNLFGEMHSGGALNYGTVFELAAGSGIVTTVLNFNGAGNGKSPLAGLVEDSNGNIWGTTSAGSPNYYGTVFELAAGSDTLIRQINLTESGTGSQPEANLYADGNGNIIGTAASDGPIGDGTLFEISPGNFTITATDATGASTSINYTLPISPDLGLGISTTSLPGWTVNVPYNQTVSTSGRISPETFEVSAGSLPPGLSLNSSTGAITGTPTTTSGSPFSFTIAVADAADNSASLDFTLSINAAPTIVTTSLTSWTVNQGGYSQNLFFNGGTSPESFAVTSGSLPTGLTLNSGTGVVTGTPTTASGNVFTITVTDAAAVVASQSYSITINQGLTISTTTLAFGTVNTPYNQSIAVSGGTGADTFSTPGNLPAGLSLYRGTGAIAGVPTATGSFYFDIYATDSTGASVYHYYLLMINTAPNIITTLPNSTVNQPYSQTIIVSGGTQPYQFAVTSGSLPPGLSLNAGTGAITGSPTTTTGSPFLFTLTATDANGATAIKYYGIHINPTPQITTTTLPGWTIGRAYSQTVSISGGTSPISFTVSAGGLPPGLSLNSATGVISGTPTLIAASPYGFTITATDATNAITSNTYMVTIVAAPVITTTALPNWTLGQAYNHTVSTSGGSPPITYTVSAGVLPTGLALNSATGIIAGTPTTTTGSPFSFTITATDAAGATGNQTYSVAIAPVLTITTFSLPYGTLGQAYNHTIATSGGTNPITFALWGGALPPGLILNSGTGTITGTPFNASGSPYDFTVKATDAAGALATQAYSLAIETAPTITTTSLPNWTVNQAFSHTITYSGGTNPITFTVSFGSLPTGLILNSTTGIITGTPTTTTGSPFSFTITATDAIGVTGSQTYSLVIAPAPMITTTSLPSWTVGQPYSHIIATSGGTNPITFSLSVGALPPGLILNSGTGTITGTPNNTAGSPYSFTVKATDAAGATATHLYSLTIAAAPTITTTSLPNWTVGQAYAHVITTSGGTSALSRLNFGIEPL